MTELVDDFQRYTSLGVRDILLEDKINKNLIRLNLSRLESSYPFNLAIRFQTEINNIYLAKNVELRIWISNITRETKFYTINGGYDQFTEDYVLNYDLLGGSLRQYTRNCGLRLPPAGNNYYIHQYYLNRSTEISEDEIFSNLEYLAETFLGNTQIDRNLLK